MNVDHLLNIFLKVSKTACNNLILGSETASRNHSSKTRDIKPRIIKH